ncbi:MAG: DUF1573 domain-containing protein [Chitinophagaceae bacterium]
MKKAIFSAAFILIAGASAYAQKAVVTPDAPAKPLTNAAVPEIKQHPEDMYFKYPLHDFGTIQEGPQAEHEFEFENKGKEPLIISNVSASCGCTTPSYSKEPVLPGKKGVIKAVYNTQGRVSPFTKTITVNTNFGVKVLTIKGEVEKAPSGSLPQNNSMIKTN